MLWGLSVQGLMHQLTRFASLRESHFRNTAYFCNVASSRLVDLQSPLDSFALSRQRSVSALSRHWGSIMLRKLFGNEDEEALPPTLQ
jgi:hypothetical protein